MAKISTSTNIDWVQVQEQGSAPATPASGYGRIYAKADGLYYVGDNGTEIGPLAAASGAAAVVARYSTNAGQSIAHNTVSIIDFEDSVIDTDTAVTTGASWKFTCPTGKGGYYRVDVNILMASSNQWQAAELLQIDIFKNGLIYSTVWRRQMDAAATLYNQGQGSDVVQLAESDYIDIRITQGSGVTIALHNDGQYNHVAISKI